MLRGIHLFQEAFIYSKNDFSCYILVEVRTVNVFWLQTIFWKQSCRQGTNLNCVLPIVYFLYIHILHEKDISYPCLIALSEVCSNTPVPIRQRFAKERWVKVFDLISRKSYTFRLHAIRVQNTEWKYAKQVFESVGFDVSSPDKIAALPVICPHEFVYGIYYI